MIHKPWFALLMAGLLAGLALMLAAAPALAVGTIIYVDKDATSGANNGSSWTDAYTTVQAALDWTNAHTTTLYEIWVAEGVYYPDEGGVHVNNALTETFVISYNNVQLYGGFAATETLRAQRNWTAHPAILSGDIDQDGALTNNAYHVLWLDGVTHESITGATVIDGFTITAGNANGGVSPNNSGGGLYCGGSGSGHACRPTLTNVTFGGNSAYYGGGMFNDGYNWGDSSPTLINVTFSGNSAPYGGGGMYNAGGNGGNSSPALTNVTFSGNSTSGDGGGMFNDGYSGGYSGASSPTLTNVIFSGNSATYYGGGMINGTLGTYDVSSPALTNVTFSGNSASRGGGMYNDGYNTRPTLVNSILWGNTAISGWQIYNDDATPVVSYSDIDEEGYAGSNGNIRQDPLFVAPVAASNAPTTAGNYRLNFGSPAIDAGSNLSVTIGADLDGNPRIVGGVVDMGAYEALVYSTLTVNVVGSGVVTSTPAGITTSVGVSVSHFVSGTVVTLAAAANAGSTFAGWSGDTDCTDGSVTMNADKSCTATFKLAATTTLTSSPNPSLYGQAVTFTATVTSTVGTPSGTVQFYADGATLGSAVALSSGAASMSTSALAGGAHAITAAYSGNAAYSASTSGVYTQTVTRLSAFNLTATPNELMGNGVSTSTLSVMARDQAGSGAPFAGYVATISWTLGFYQPPVTVTLDAQGVATTTYTAGSTPGVDILTATIRDAYQSLTATTTITLKDNPLVGSFHSQYGAIITYTLIVTNAHPTDTQTNVIISGSIPANTQFVSVSGGTHVTTGGDYGWGYAASPVIASLPPGQSVTLRWTVRPILWVGDILNVSHGASDTAVLRLALADRVYRLMLQIVMFNGAL